MDKKATERQKLYFQELLASRGLSTIAREGANIPRQTLWRWRKEQWFVEREREIHERLEAHYLAVLDRLAQEGNVTAVIFALKSLNPEKYDDALRRKRAEIRSVQEAPKVTIMFNRGAPPERITEDEPQRIEESY